MLVWIAVGVGGALGAMARHGVNAIVQALVPGSTFPLGILVVNVLGSVTVGLVAGVLVTGQIHLPYAARAFLVVGLLGGFTTFSSFSLDTLAMARQGQFEAATLNAVGHFALTLVAVWAGFRTGLLFGPNST